MKTFVFSSKNPLNTVINDEGGDAVYSISTSRDSTITKIHKSIDCDIPAVELPYPSNFQLDDSARDIEVHDSVSMEEIGRIRWNHLSGKAQLICNFKILDADTFMPPTRNWFQT